MVLRLPRITGRELQEVVRAILSAAGGLDGWAWSKVKALPLPWFSGLAVHFGMVGVWPQGLLDAYVAMIPKADGDSEAPQCSSGGLQVCGPLFGLVIFGNG